MMALVPDAQRSITVGDVVTFQFPYKKSATLKNRPCFVLHEDHETDEVVIAYGTSSFDPRDVNTHEMTASCPEMLSEFNLKKPTRFIFKRRIRVRKDDPRFCIKPCAGTSRIGGLPAYASPFISKCYKELPFREKSEERLGIHPAKPKAPTSILKTCRLFGGRRGRPKAVQAA
ncbi:hypothetical protein K3556_08805 [Aliiroseovarius sp. M344]|uniref:hypothetical protein n=1 Tax=Aliiroseovarius sp. M344 TaxID=2867010 RepID=UPI0021AD5F06|nr:hypothetical protein [Aliiroseovarius sp. M344]UWQ13074.1 hypothetical protein K3556_08805 [Aliiroseovarius sp. M344]